MDFRLNAEHAAFRAEVDAFFAEHLTADIRATAWHTGTLHDAGLHAAIADRGWIAATFPADVGGHDMAPADFVPFWEAANYVGAPIDGLQLTEVVGHVLDRVGTPEQRTDLVPRILAGEIVIALGFSEADSGSDVAAAATQAVREGDGYRINGAKMFTTMGHVADYVFLLTRTDPDRQKHLGLTMFLVPLDAPGVEIRPIETFSGERTNATYYDNVLVPESARVGEENGGWRVLMMALDAERASVGGWLGQLRRLFDQTVEALEATRPALLASESVRDRLTDINVAIEAAAVLADRVACRLSAGEGAGDVPPAEAAMTKLLVTDVLKDLSYLALDLVGPAALLTEDAAGAPVGGSLEHTFRHAQIATIYGGSNEIQRNIIARRGLGLPVA